MEKLHVLMCGFKKGLIAVYGNHIFLKLACVGKKQLLQFRCERFIPEAFEKEKNEAFLLNIKTEAITISIIQIV